MAQERTIGDRVDDATITATVKTKLVADRAQNLLNIDVDTRDGVVQLEGTVPTEQARMEAERLARATKGVREVRNELKVGARTSESPRDSGPAASPPTR